MAKIHYAKPSEAHRADENGTLSWTPMERRPQPNPNACGRKPSRGGVGVVFTLATTDHKRVTCGACIKILDHTGA